jgi:hypothetical protein
VVAVAARQGNLAGEHGAQHGRQPLLADVPAEIARGAGQNGLEELFAARTVADDDEAYAGALSRDLARGVDPAPGQRRGEHRRIRPKVEYRGDGRPRVCRLCDHMEPGRVERYAYSNARRRVGIRQHDPRSCVRPLSHAATCPRSRA